MLDRLLDLADIVRFARCGPVTLEVFQRIHYVHERDGTYRNTRIALGRVLSLSHDLGHEVALEPIDGREAPWSLRFADLGRLADDVERRLDAIPTPEEHARMIRERRLRRQSQRRATARARRAG